MKKSSVILALILFSAVSQAPALEFSILRNGMSKSELDFVFSALRKPKNKKYIATTLMRDVKLELVPNEPVKTHLNISHVDLTLGKKRVPSYLVVSAQGLKLPKGQMKRILKRKGLTQAEYNNALKKNQVSLSFFLNRSGHGSFTEGFSIAIVQVSDGIVGKGKIAASALRRFVRTAMRSLHSRLLIK